MSTLERHNSLKKAPKPTESVEEAALKASAPMPRALLIVTSAFLSSNSDWWVHQGRGGGGGVFFRGDRERLVVKNSVFKSHLSCQRADTGHPGTRGLCCTECGHWPSFSPPPSTTTTTSHLQNTPQPPHLICSLLSSWPQWTATLLLLLTPPLWASTASCACFLWCFSLSQQSVSKKKTNNDVYNKCVQNPGGTRNRCVFNGLLMGEVKPVICISWALLSNGRNETSLSINLGLTDSSCRGDDLFSSEEMEYGVFVVYVLT